MVRNDWKLLPINHLATNRHIPSNKPENIEEFCKSALGKSDPAPVLITAYIPNTFFSVCSILTKHMHASIRFLLTYLIPNCLRHHLHCRSVHHCAEHQCDDHLYDHQMLHDLLNYDLQSCDLQWSVYLHRIIISLTAIKNLKSWKGSGMQFTSGVRKILCLSFLWPFMFVDFQKTTSEYAKLI